MKIDKEKDKQIKLLEIRLNQLYDEEEALEEGLKRAGVYEDGEADMIIAELDLLGNIIGKLEEELELLR